MFKNVFASLKVAICALILFSALAFFSAPVFFGMVIITASVVATVVGWSLISFLVSLFYFVFKSETAKKKEKNDADSNKS